MILRIPYNTDISDQQWQLLEPHLPVAKTGGRKRTTNLREVINAMFYLIRTGCPWRLLPHDFPQWQTVYGYFRQWQKDGTWVKLNELLRQKVRLKSKKEGQKGFEVYDVGLLNAPLLGLVAIVA
jgi:putative transposase